MTVTSEQMPGRMLLRPPEKPAKKWGSMKPSVTSRSHSTAKRFTSKSAPEGRVQICTKSSGLKASLTAIFSLSTMASPNIRRCSSGVVARWRPVAIRMVISASGLPARISSKRMGRVILLGTARVWSLVTKVTRFFPFASSESRGEPMGFARASRTSSSSPFSAL